MAVRRTVSHSLDQLRDLWQLILLYANSILQPHQAVGALVLEFLHTLTAVALRIVSLRPKMSFVQKYCLQWSLCVEDCSKMLGMGNGYLPQSLLTSITELILVSAQEIPELVSALREQLGPVIHNEDTGKLLGPYAPGAHQVRFP